jgi:hypothetical protein
LQQVEFAAEAEGYTATRHQREVGVGYFAGRAVVGQHLAGELAMDGTGKALGFAEVRFARFPP